MKHTALISLIMLCTLGTRVGAQCFNTDQFPLEDIPASSFASVVTVISDSMEPGQYCVVNNLMSGRQYSVESSVEDDFVTVRINGGTESDAPLAEGTLPLSFTASSHVHELHINLASPSCGSESTPRTVTITCDNCDEAPGNAGVNSPAPSATLDVGGKVKLTDDANPPEAGMIRFNSQSQDFEGYDGEKWLSLTQPAGSWGRVSSAEAIESGRILASDGQSTDRFGNSVSVSGDYLIVGAYSESNLNVGAAYIFKRSGNSWVEQAKITADDGANFDQFGWSVSISGDYVIVGAYRDNVGSNNDQGSAYVFVRSDTVWTQQAKLTADDGAAGDEFGHSVSISGNYAIIGAPLDEVGSNLDQGSAYVFQRVGTTWVQQVKLVADDGTAEDLFGYSVSMSGDYAVAGAPQDRPSPTSGNRGSIYIFARTGSTWVQQDEHLYVGRSMGRSVSLSGDYLLGNGAAGNGNEEGHAVLYKRSGSSWDGDQFLTTSSSEFGDSYGARVSISGDYAIVTALGSFSQYQSYAVVFERSGTSWREKARLTASDGFVGDLKRFGAAATIGVHGAFVGAEMDDVNGQAEQGSVYFFLNNE